MIKDKDLRDEYQISLHERVLSFKLNTLKYEGYFLKNTLRKGEV
jgi:hypothetical protein